MQEFLLIQIAVYFVTTQDRIIKSFNSIHVYNRPILRIKSTSLVFKLKVNV